MTTYIAFLRGVNVGAHNRMKMDELRELCESIGLDDVQTYIQSGNVLFDAAETDENALRRAIADGIKAEFGYDLPVMVRTRAELADIIARQPFDEPSNEAINHYVTFLDEEPTDDQVEALLAAESEAERFVVIGREVYSELDKDTLGSGRFTDAGKKLGTSATRRNWGVVTAIVELDRH